MSIERMLEILDRTRQGPVCATKEWNTRVIPGKVSQKLKEHGLNGTFTPEDPINTDDALADEFFKAAFELALDIGILCYDTERIVKVTEEEIKEAISSAPSELALGKGHDRVVIKHRKPEDKHIPACNAPLGLVVSEDIWVPLMQAIIENRQIDTFQGASVTTIFGHPVLAGTPYETLVGRYQAQLTREALWRAGRPGMGTLAVISSTTAFGQLGGFGIDGGFDPATDLVLALATGELQTAYVTLHKVAHTINCGGTVYSGFTAMIGGYPGPPEGAALAIIAAGLIHIVVDQANSCFGGTVLDARYGGNCGREGQWAMSIAMQAVTRNTHFLKFNPMNQVAGPCTEMLLYESAVGMLNFTASGGAMVLVPRSGGGKYTDHMTPLECKFCAEVVKRSAGMTRKQVNEIAKVLIPKYEAMLMNPPKGKGVRECCDVKTFKPNQEWLDIYLKVKRELIEMGVPLEYP